MLAHRPRLAAGVLAAIFVVFATFTMSSGEAGAAEAMTANEQGPRLGVILAHLPLKTSRAYHRLRAVAGNPAGEILAMTKAEMWSIPADRLDALKQAAAVQHVTVTVVDSNANRALEPMSEAVAMTPKQSAMMHEAMQDKAAMGMAIMQVRDAVLLEYALTAGMSGPAPRDPGPAIVLPLNDTTRVTIKRTSVSRTAGGYEWHGVIEGSGDPVSLLWWPPDRLSGTIKYADHLYSLHSIGGGLHAVMDIAPKMLPPEHAPMPQDMRERMRLERDPLVEQGDASKMMPPVQRPGDAGSATAPASDPAGDPASEPASEKGGNLQDAPQSAMAARAPTDWLAMSRDLPRMKPAEMTIISLVVAATKAAARHYTDISADLVALAVAEANQSFRNSAIANVAIEVVHTYVTDYVEAGSHFDHVFKFAEKGDGVMDEIHGLRDKYKADVAALIVDDANGCGLSAGVAPPAERAFVVIHHGCAALSYSLGHEIGHIIGARHDIGLDKSDTPFAFGHGYVNGRKWRTMMSYEQSCEGCPRLPFWSNPDILIKGEPAGGALSNNARVIREGAKRVAAFR